eukprot:GHVU01142092.1.p1 GENE.GHVU01142092.1~~GHVU01142092.1.p1  ORF type:complete len:200 (+),score=35.96 GHVU01142092.1:324-923(+)
MRSTATLSQCEGFESLPKAITESLRIRKIETVDELLLGDFLTIAGLKLEDEVRLLGFCRAVLAASQIPRGEPTAGVKDRGGEEEEEEEDGDVVSMGGAEKQEDDEDMEEGNEDGEATANMEDVADPRALEMDGWVSSPVTRTWVCAWRAYFPLCPRCGVTWCECVRADSTICSEGDCGRGKRTSSTATVTCRPPSPRSF